MDTVLFFSRTASAPFRIFLYQPDPGQFLGGIILPIVETECLQKEKQREINLLNRLIAEEESK